MFDLPPVEMEITHELGDHVPAHEVVGLENVAAFDREPVRVEGRVVRAQLLDVLSERASDVTDGGDAGPKHVGRRHRRVAHEVSMQRPIPGGNREHVRGEREMVHPDLDVAGVQEPLECVAEELELQLPGREVARIDTFLVPAKPWNVGV